MNDGGPTNWVQALLLSVVFLSSFIHLGADRSWILLLGGALKAASRAMSRGFGLGKGRIGLLPLPMTPPLQGLLSTGGAGRRLRRKGLKLYRMFCSNDKSPKQLASQTTNRDVSPQNGPLPIPPS
ncbi:hypothetical protein L249_2427 [Ophiocordyceps polyrhachis-furcata BCC 54312]|uniref:Uncharacterized protein n=1 Tax=Ophiocordyceps polyrhachis-furcata BCC 54312 TaxID=1330021 RepID=A0A367LSL3_9HYPO|nr:hypothetical protein L249_2427 [Ophiocordyceps polyrhachis-furcata BCC 54312]